MLIISTERVSNDLMILLACPTTTSFDPLIGKENYVIEEVIHWPQI